MFEAESFVTIYHCDPMHRLNAESRTTTNAYSYSYGLDGAGNRTSKTVSGTATGYTNDGDDRVTAVGSDSYTYNANGETTTKTISGTTYNFAYTYDGLISEYNTNGSNTVSFGYDALGRRILRTASGVTTRYYFDGGKILREMQAGSVTATYAYGNSLLRKDGEYPLFDGMGHERTVTNSSQTVTGTINYDAYGNTVGTSGSSASPYMYGANSGYRNDGDAGLSYVAARYYDSAIGRFTTRDTYLGQKPYTYCDNDPVNCLDPSGHIPNWIRAIMLAIDLFTGGEEPEPDSPKVETPIESNQGGGKGGGKGGGGKGGGNGGGDDGGENPIITGGKIILKSIIVVGIWEGIKWGGAVILAPETGGLSLAAAAAAP